jgi:hypothetical protein
VNLFRGRMKDGAVEIGGTEFALPETGGKAERRRRRVCAPARHPHHARGHGTEEVFPRASSAAMPPARWPPWNLERLDGGGAFTVQMSQEQFQALPPKSANRFLWS